MKSSEGALLTGNTKGRVKNYNSHEARRGEAGKITGQQNAARTNMGPEAALFFGLCLLAAGLPGTQAYSKDCHNISKVVLEGHEAIVPLNTSETMDVDKWNSTNSHWECALLSMNGKSYPSESKFENQLTVSQENFTVKNASREAQGVYRVRLFLSRKCVALIKLTVQAPMPPPSVIPGNQAPAAHPASWALFLIPITVAIVI